MLLSTHSHANGGGESDLPACGPPASFSVYMVSRAVTPVRHVQKSRGDNVGAVEEMMCECYKGGIVVMDVIWHQLCSTI